MSTTDNHWPESASVHAGGSGEPVTSKDTLLKLTGGQGPDEAIAATRKFLSSMESSSRHEDVLAVAEHGIALCSRDQHRAERLEFMLIKGWRLLRLVALESAALVLADADSLALQIGNRRGSAEVLRQIGLLHGLAGDIELADRNFSRSIEMFRSDNNDYDLSDALMGLSVTRWRQGQRKLAIELALSSIEAATRSDNWNVAIHTNANLASYYLETDDFQQADAPLSRAEQIYVERGMVPFWGWALTLANRADYLDRAGEPTRAVDLYLRAIAMCEQLGEVVMRPPIEKMIASLLEKQGDFKGAFNHLQQAHQFTVTNANRGRALEIQALRGSLELTNERREKHHLGAMVEQRTEELQREIDTRRAAEERAHALAFNDPLTGLPNRRRLTELLEQALVHANLHGTAVGVLFVDLDQFSLINDASGHEVGDLVLVEIAGRLKRITGAREAVCRFGGDEFVIVVPELKTDEGASGNVDKVIEEVFAAFAEPFQIGASERSIKASIGVARYPEHSQDAAQLVRFADIAMYAAKRSGRLTVAEFSESLSDALVFRTDLTRDFRRSLAEGQFHLAYQPKVEVTTGQVVGLEALARWDHPGYGSVPPAVFIGFFEETGAIHEFGRWAIRTVCSQLARWRSAGVRTVRVAVNVSQKQLQDHAFADFIGECLLDAGVNGGSIEIEITESTLLTDAARVIEVLQRISKLGVHISIDDFGTGYSSLSLLSKLPFDSIKIDQSFIAAMLDGASERMIVQTIIRMAEALGKSVTAEGVETKAQLDALAFERCGFCQGMLFGMPERAELVESRIGKRSR